MVIRSRSTTIPGGILTINGEYGNDSATITIDGITLPHIGGFRPLNDGIWPCLRKRIAEKYGADVVGLFDCRATGGIDCKFFLNYGNQDNVVCKIKTTPYSKETTLKVGLYTYKGMFVDSFEHQVDLINSVLVKFIKAKKNGLDDYLALAERDRRARYIAELREAAEFQEINISPEDLQLKTVTAEECKEMIHNFLRSAGYRTEADELRVLEEAKRAKERTRKVAQATKENRAASRPADPFTFIRETTRETVQ